MTHPNLKIYICLKDIQRIKFSSGRMSGRAEPMRLVRGSIISSEMKSRFEIHHPIKPGRTGKVTIWSSTCVMCLPTCYIRYLVYTSPPCVS